MGSTFYQLLGVKLMLCNFAEPWTVLNKRSDLISKCWQGSKFLIYQWKIDITNLFNSFTSFHHLIYFSYLYLLFIINLIYLFYSTFFFILFHNFFSNELIYLIYPLSFDFYNRYNFLNNFTPFRLLYKRKQFEVLIEKTNYALTRWSCLLVYLKSFFLFLIIFILISFINFMYLI